LFINFSVPPFLNLIGELEVLVILLSFSWAYFLLGGFIVLLVAAYCVYCFRMLVHGSGSFSKSIIGEGEIIFFVCIIHLFPLLFLTIKVDLFYFSSLKLK
jgi:hypothetical protein